MEPEESSLSENNSEESHEFSIEGASDLEKKERDVQFVSDVPLRVQVELGQISIRIKDLLSLKEGSVIELNKLAGEPLEILINERLVCRGEVIVVNEKYGIRMTDIIKPHEGQESGKSTPRGT